MIKSFVAAAAVAGWLFSGSTAQAQFVFGGSRVPGGLPGQAFVQPGQYFGLPGGTNFNPFTGSVYRPWAGTVNKFSGNYFYVPGTGSYTPFGRLPGTGVYQNPWSGNLYNPGSGAYIRQNGFRW